MASCLWNHRLTAVCALLVVCSFASSVHGQATAPSVIIRTTVETCKRGISPGSVVCDRKIATNTGVESILFDGYRESSAVVTNNGETMRATTHARNDIAVARGPAFWDEVSGTVTVEVYLKYTTAETDIYQVYVDQIYRHTESTGIHLSANAEATTSVLSQDSLGLPQVGPNNFFLEGTAGDFRGGFVSFPEYPGIQYKGTIYQGLSADVRHTIALNDGVDERMFGLVDWVVEVKARLKPVLPPQIEVSPITIDFEAVRKGTLVSQDLQIKNIGSPLSTLNVSLSTPDLPFKLIGATSFSLTGGNSRIVKVEFMPTQIRMSKSKITVTSNDPDPQRSSIDVTIKGATIATFMFIARAFIPKNIGTYTKELPAPFTGITYIPFPFEWAAFAGFYTDQRDFTSSSTAESRVTLIGNYTITGYDQFVSAGLPPPFSNVTTFVDLRTLYMQKARENPSGKFSVPEKTEERKFKITYEATATNPFTPPIEFAIDYEGRLDLDFADGKINLMGLVDDFPAYEMYVKVLDGVTDNDPIELFKFSPIPPVTNLFGRASQPVSKIASF